MIAKTSLRGHPDKVLDGHQGASAVSDHEAEFRAIDGNLEISVLAVQFNRRLHTEGLRQTIHEGDGRITDQGWIDGITRTLLRLVLATVATTRWASPASG